MSSDWGGEAAVVPGGGGGCATSCAQGVGIVNNYILTMPTCNGGGDPGELRGGVLPNGATYRMRNFCGRSCQPERERVIRSYVVVVLWRGIMITEKVRPGPVVHCCQRRRQRTPRIPTERQGVD